MQRILECFFSGRLLCHLGQAFGICEPPASTRALTDLNLFCKRTTSKQIPAEGVEEVTTFSHLSLLSSNDVASPQSNPHLNPPQSLQPEVETVAANDSSDFQTRVSFFPAASNFSVHGGKFYNVGGDMVITRTDNHQDNSGTPQGIIPGSRVITAEDVPPEQEIHKGQGYRLYSATSAGKAIAVKLYEGSRAKERCFAAARFNQRVMHPNVLHLIGVSPLNCELPFLVFNGDYEGTVETMIASALRKDLERSLVLGIQTVIGLATGLDYLRSQNFPFASVGLDHFTVLFSSKGKTMITFDPEVLVETDEVKQYPAASDAMNWEFDIFNGLCQKTFDAACKGNYERQQIQRTYIDELDAERFEELEDDTEQLPGTSGVSDSVGQNLQSLLYSRKPRRELPKIDRRELVWKAQNHDIVSLEDLSRQFQEFLHTSSSSSAFSHRRGRYTTKTVHRCPGYNRIEITLTTDITRSAIVSHSTPIPHEICPVCKETVKDSEVFNCVCGDKDDESMPTIRCLNCSQWHHRPCVDVDQPENWVFVCARCQSTPEPLDSNIRILFYVKALYDYTATIDEEFDFMAGDIIGVTATPEDGWWSGQLLDDARRVKGRDVFPSNFVCLF